MVEHCSYVIVGGGIAGVTAAETLRNEEPSAEITVIADTPLPAYYRPALKDYLAGRVTEDTLYVRRRSFYADLGIHFMLDRAVRIAVNQHALQLSSGRQVGYDRLLLATGARASRLSCPGSDLAGVITLRTIADYQAALRLLQTARRVVVCGSGSLALETVEILQHRGIQVTHLLRSRRLWKDILDRTASELVLHQEEQDGVDIRVEEEIAEVIGKKGDGGQVLGIITKNGARIPCDVVVTAIGIEPAVDFMKESGIACGRGVKVDHAMRTSIPDIFAIGDAAETSDPVTGRERIFGQWYPAMQQGRTAAYSMLGMLGTQHLRHAETYSNAYLRSISAQYLYGFDVAAIGITNVSSPEYQEIQADPRTHIYSKVLLKDGIPVGMLSFDGRRDALAFKRAIDHAVNLMPVASLLFNRDFKLTTWLDAQKVPTPVLAVRKLSQAPRPLPVLSMKSQFVGMSGMGGMTPLLDLPREDIESVNMRSNTDPYMMPVVTMSGSRRGDAGREERRQTNRQEERSMRTDTYTHTSIPTAAFLVPILPEKTADMLRTQETQSYALSLDQDNTGALISPEWAHTQISQTQAVTIGREPNSTLIINHNSISRRHAEIIYRNGDYLLRDLGSKNGTFINEAPLAPGHVHVLKPRDRIRIGKLMTYLFQVRAIAPNPSGSRL